MIKTKVNTKEDESTLVFPLMAVAQDAGAIVLFEDECQGTCLASGSGSREVGSHSEFNSVFASCWKILPSGSTVTLEQRV